jgi:hypothetical protein
VLDQAASTGFSGKVIAGPTQHLLNNGATTTSTETTANGKQNVWETTSTTDATQQNTGNGQTLHKSTTTSTTSTEHQQTFTKVNVHASTTDLPAAQETEGETSPATPLCGGTAFLVASKMKTTCLHVKGGAGAGGFAVSSVKRPVITAACTPGSPNQMFSLIPTPAGGGMLLHDASQMVISLASATVTNGAGVFLAAPQAGAVTQEWVWTSPDVGGVIASVADANFEMRREMRRVHRERTRPRPAAWRGTTATVWGAP